MRLLRCYDEMKKLGVAVKLWVAFLKLDITKASKAEIYDNDVQGRNLRDNGVEDRKWI